MQTQKTRLGDTRRDVWQRTLLLSRCALCRPVFALGIVLALLMLHLPAAQAQDEQEAVLTLPPDFADELIASIGSATSLAFTPDGRILVTTQGGRLFVIKDGALLPEPALNFKPRTCSDGERGMTGVAVDPNFATNQAIYLFYTYAKYSHCERKSKTSPVNRVVRFALPDSNEIDPQGETVLIDGIPSYGGMHNGGDLQFGKDGYLYVSVGDGQCDYDGEGGCWGKNDAARDPHSLLGKILRITTDGGIPPTNPYQGADSARCNEQGSTTPGKKCQENFASGLRNPFRIAFDPNAAETRFFINDVGEKDREEIDEGKADADYGWNVREGRCSRKDPSECGPQPPEMTNPIYDYDHESVCGTITGGAFVPNGIWPEEFDGSYLYADWRCGEIFRLGFAEDGKPQATQFVKGMGIGSVTTLRFGPNGKDQALYYTTLAGDGQVHRIVYRGTRAPAPTPTIVQPSPLAATPSSDAAPISPESDDNSNAMSLLIVGLMGAGVITGIGALWLVAGRRGRR